MIILRMKIYRVAQAASSFTFKMAPVLSSDFCTALYVHKNNAFFFQIIVTFFKFSI